ncbi:hypothetical protein LQ47_25005 [Klebsiella pneumoniae]|nr:hypothetical protein LQ47_25005 [Klebsiella pneumoniae]
MQEFSFLFYSFNLVIISYITSMWAKLHFIISTRYLFQSFWCTIIKIIQALKHFTYYKIYFMKKRKVVNI